MDDLATVKLNEAATAQDVFPLYERLREAGGIMWSQRHKAWLISRYDYVKALLLAPQASVEKVTPAAEHAGGAVRGTMLSMHRIMEHWLPFIDPPEHTRMRLVLQRSFTPRAVQAHEEIVRAAARQAIADFGDRREIEFLDEFGFQFPALVITRLFGLSPDDLGRVKEWAAGVGEFVLGSSNPDRYERSAAVLAEMKACLEDLVDKRSGELDAGASPTDILLDQLILAGRGENPLTRDEIVSTLILILFAAPETTASMLVNTMLNLIVHKPRLKELMAEPERIGQAIDELIRYDGPVPTVVRVARDDVVIGGETIRAGQRVFLLLKSANRDPLQFPAPDVLDFSRGRSPHLGLGVGPHLCLGAHLARLEVKVALEELFARYADFDLAGPAVVWRHDLLAHSPHALHITVTPHAG